MKKFDLKILDCTLRDGGYVNNWKFGRLKIQSLIMRLDAAGIDIIEAGFLDRDAEYSEDRTVFPEIRSVERTLGNCRPQRAELVAMIEYGHFDASGLIPRREAAIDGIRLIFGKHDVENALALAGEIKRSGYKLYLNPVSIFSYSDSEIIALTERMNDALPAGVSIVDTYGVMFWQNVEHYVDLLNHNLNADIALGLHSHNNLELSNANTIEFIRMNLMRDQIADVSVLGMGRRAGNASTEVICSWLDKFSAKDVDIDQVLECAYSEIAVFRGNQNWGYNLDGLIAAIFECSTSWVQYFLNKNTLSVSSIRKIISTLPKYERSLGNYYSKSLAEEKYLEYVQHEIDDTDSFAGLRRKIGGRPVLLLCPGRTANEFEKDIDAYILKNDPLVVSVNFLPSHFKIDCCFVSNSKRAEQIAIQSTGNAAFQELLVTSNVLLPSGLTASATFNLATLFDEIGGDNSCILLLRILKKIGGVSVAIVGFDGYMIDHPYVDDSLEWFQPDKGNDDVVRQINRLNDLDGEIRMIMLTPSDYSRCFTAVRD